MKRLASYVFFLAFLTGKCTAHCPDTWVTFQDSCYFFSVDAKTFTESEHFCIQRNAHLVKVDSNDENLFLKSFSSELKDSGRWIGLTDADVEGIWKWTDGSRASFKDFYPGEPNEKNNGNCVLLWYGYNYQWVDTSCSLSRRPICEKRESSVEESVVG